MLVENIEGMVSRKRRNPSQRLIHYTAQTIDVASVIKLLSQTLFRAHKARAAHDLTNLSETII
ncbi:MAG: hypothetical protein BWY75_02816 [bacterium ADurb.Bin425]|nr:MAG: hypothetical protein BWY75_02816 [bacterium ADurb.Bin425]